MIYFRFRHHKKSVRLDFKTSLWYVFTLVIDWVSKIGIFWPESISRTRLIFILFGFFCYFFKNHILALNISRVLCPIFFLKTRYIHNYIYRVYNLLFYLSLFKNSAFSLSVTLRALIYLFNLQHTYSQIWCGVNFSVVL